MLVLVLKLVLVLVVTLAVIGTYCEWYQVVLVLVVVLVVMYSLESAEIWIPESYRGGSGTGAGTS